MNIPPWPTPLNSLILKGGAGFRHDSAALCADGRVIYVYVDGGAGIYQCHYHSVTSFEVANNDIATTPVEFHTLINSTIATCRTTVWRSPAGVLLLFVVYRSTSAYAGGKVYSSPSGNGESAPGVPDWVLHGTITPDNYASFVYIGDAMNVGEPYVVGSRWVLPAFYPLRWDNHRLGAYTSDDSGVTWTKRLEIGYSSGGNYGQGQGRNIVSHSGKLWWGSSGNVEGPKMAWSSDNGTSWTQFFPNDANNSGISNPLCSDGTNCWRVGPPTFNGRTVPTIQVGPGYDSAAAAWTTIGNGGMPTHTPEGAILQKLSPGHSVFLWDGHILGVIDDIKIRQKQRGDDRKKQRLPGQLTARKGRANTFR